MEFGLPNYQSGAFYTKLVRDWSDVQEDNGWIHHTAPQINRHYGGPMWSSAGLNIAWAFYEAYGDLRILESTYPSTRRWLEFLAGHVENGLLQNYADHWGKFLGDWAAPGGRKERGGTPAALYFNNCVYAMNLSDFSKIAHILNKPDDAELYSRRLQELKARIHQRFFHPETATYADGTQVQQAFALLVDIVPEELRPKVLEGIVQDIKGKHPYLDMGSSGLPVLLKYIIEDSGRSDLLFDPLAKTTLPSYGYFLTQGETTWPEYWEVNVPSRIHTCYTGIAAWFTKSLAGIRPDPEHPGFQRFFIDPLVIPEVTFAEASTESPYGVIKSRWEKQGQILRVHVTIPANSEAIISFPIGDPKSITEGDMPIGQAEGVTCLEAQGDTVILKVQSGIYEFSSKLK